MAPAPRLSKPTTPCRPPASRLGIFYKYSAEQKWISTKICRCFAIVPHSPKGLAEGFVHQMHCHVNLCMLEGVCNFMHFKMMVSWLKQAEILKLVWDEHVMASYYHLNQKAWPVYACNILVGVVATRSFGWKWDLALWSRQVATWKCKWKPIQKKIFLFNKTLNSSKRIILRIIFAVGGFLL